jgi:hypothetical protein
MGGDWPYLLILVIVVVGLPTLFVLTMVRLARRWRR